MKFVPNITVVPIGYLFCYLISGHETQGTILMNGTQAFVELEKVRKQIAEYNGIVFIEPIYTIPEDL